jgi:hypothetical protein
MPTNTVSRDLTNVVEGKALASVGSLSAHTRPVECIAGIAHSETKVLLMTADTMGLIKVWELEKESGPQARWRSNLQDTLDYHRTRITEILYGAGQIWTGELECWSSHSISLIDHLLSFFRRDGSCHFIPS